ncbi:hypothetical protein D3C86_1197580 [compost metagenome]
MLLEVICGVLRIEDYRRIEKREERDQQAIERHEQRLSVLQRRDDRSRPGRQVGIAGKTSSRCRQKQQRRCEDRGNDAGGVELQRQMRSIALEHPVADLSLRILNEQTALGALHEDDKSDDTDGDHDNHQDERGRKRTGTAEFERAGERLGQACGNTREDDQRNTVADTTRSDLLTEPHQEHRAAEQRDDGGNAEEPAGIDHKAVAAFKADRNTIGLQRAEQHRAVAGVLVDDLAAGFAFLLQRFERRHDRRHELHDDRSGDVRHDAEGEDRHALDSATRKHVEKTENTVGLATEGLRIGFGVQARKRNMGAETVDEKCGKSKPETLFQILRLSEGRKIQVRSQLFRC